MSSFVIHVPDTVAYALFGLPTMTHLPFTSPNRQLNVHPAPWNWIGVLTPMGRQPYGSVSFAVEYWLSPDESNFTLPLTMTMDPCRSNRIRPVVYGGFHSMVWVSETYLIRAFSHVFCAVRSTSMSGRR